MDKTGTLGQGKPGDGQDVILTKTDIARTLKARTKDTLELDLPTRVHIRPAARFQSRMLREPE
jgi:hypothetical protein